MRFADRCKLAFREFSYAKKECFLSVIIQVFLIVGMFFSLTLFIHVSDIGNGFLGKAFSDGFEFELFGFHSEDEQWLKENGFTDVLKDEKGNPVNGTLLSIGRIWKIKFLALINGKDIWNGSLDDGLNILLFLHFIFGVTVIILFIIWMNNVSNSFAMKQVERKNYVSMIHRLGMSKGNICSIFGFYFGVRYMISFVCAVALNLLLIFFTNEFLSKTFGTSYKLPGIINGVLILTTCLSGVFLLISCVKMRRNQSVFEG